MSEVLSTSTLPILIFCEATLNPSLGYVSDPKWLEPFESLVSMLWKFAWMNRLAGHVVVTHVAARAIDPYEGVAGNAGDVDVRRVATTLAIRQKTVRQALAYRGKSHEALRFCSRCMAHSYHSVVHQLGRVTTCPVHDCALATTCPACGAASAYRLDARLLGAPFRCAQCGRRYAKTNCLHRTPLSRKARIAITRAALF